MVTGHKITCPKCKQPGWERIKKVKGHEYRYIVHIKECYLGPTTDKTIS